MTSPSPVQMAATVGLLRITNDHLSNYLYGLNIDPDLLTLYSTAANIISFFTFSSLLDHFYKGIGSLEKTADEAQKCIKDGLLSEKKITQACEPILGQAGSLFISEIVGKTAAKLLASTVDAGQLTWKKIFTLHRAELSHMAILGTAALTLGYMRLNP
jgi:hypothetical protein